MKHSKIKGFLKVCTFVGRFLQKPSAIFSDFFRFFETEGVTPIIQFIELRAIYRIWRAFRKYEAGAGPV
jgi:hypothetical protein